MKKGYVINKWGGAPQVLGNMMVFCNGIIEGSLEVKLPTSSDNMDR